MGLGQLLSVLTKETTRTMVLHALAGLQNKGGKREEKPEERMVLEGRLQLESLGLEMLSLL